MSGYGRWRAASVERADLARTWVAGIAYAGAVCFVLAMVPILARCAAFPRGFMFFPGLY